MKFLIAFLGVATFWTLLFMLCLSWIGDRVSNSSVKGFLVAVLWFLFLACYGASLVLVSSWME
jgi:hypothetical protein